MISREDILGGVNNNIIIKKVFKEYDNDEYLGIFDRDFEFFDGDVIKLLEIRDTLSLELKKVTDLCLLVTRENKSLPAICAIMSYCQYNNININIVYYNEDTESCKYQYISNRVWYKLFS